MEFCSPTQEEFCQLAQKGNLIPVTRRLLADQETPLTAYRKLRDRGESFLFESVEGGEHLGRYSFVGCNPRGMIRQKGNLVEWIEGGQVRETYTVVGRAGGQAKGEVCDGLEVVEKVLANYKPVTVDGLPRFTGGALGFVGHEFIHDIEPVIPRPPEDELDTPTICLVIADQLLVFDRVAQTLTIIVNGVIDPGDWHQRCMSVLLTRLLELLHCSSNRSNISRFRFLMSYPKRRFNQTNRRINF